MRTARTFSRKIALRRAAAEETEEAETAAEERDAIIADPRITAVVQTAPQRISLRARNNTAAVKIFRAGYLPKKCPALSFATSLLYAEF
jgi:hypothetical protein